LNPFVRVSFTIIETPLKTKISFYWALPSIANLHFHFSRKIISNFLLSFIPSPTSSSLLHVVSHFTLSSSSLMSHVHMKSSCILTTSFFPVYGILKIDRKNKGMAESTNLTKHSFLVRDKREDIPMSQVCVA